MTASHRTGSSFVSRWLSALASVAHARRLLVLGLGLLSLSAGLSGCGQVDINQEPSAAAACEPPLSEDLEPQPTMLPGRRCEACHQKGSQAGRRVWTAAGTVYDRPDSPCNSGVVAGAKVEIADETRKVLVTLYTNSRGNFYTSEPLRYTGIIVRVSKDGKVREMQGAMGSTDCASCHFPGGSAGGRVYLN
jgi:hypothetical protein